MTTAARHYIVCVKAVFATRPGLQEKRTSENSVINPFDRIALASACRLREQTGGTVTVLSLGPETAAFVLYEALAFGGDDAVLVSDPALAGGDTLATAVALTAAIRLLPVCDVLFFGSRTADSDTGHVGPQTATCLDIPLLTGVFQIDPGDRHGAMTVHRRCDDFEEIFACAPPFAVTVCSEAPQPSHLRLGDISRVYAKKHIRVMRLSETGLDPDQAGESGSPTRVVSMTRPRVTARCDFLPGTVEEQVDQLLKRIYGTGAAGLP